MLVPLVEQTDVSEAEGSVDAQRFAVVVEAMLPDLYGAAMRLCRNASDAQDLVADSVAAAWIHRAACTDRGKFRGWLFTILNNRFRDCRRQDLVRGSATPLDDEQGEESFSLFEKLHQPILLWWSDPERVLTGKLVRADFERAVDALPDPLRVVVVLAYLENFRYEQIANQLSIPIGTVRSRLGRARARLQRTLWNHAVDAGLVGGAPPNPDTR